MKRNLVLSIGLASIIGVGAVTAGGVIANQSPDTCSYDPVSGNFMENGVEHSWGSWEHARLCAQKGLLPEVVLNRLGAFGDAKTRAEAEKLKAENRRVAALRQSEELKKLSAKDAGDSPSQMAKAPNETTQPSRVSAPISENQSISDVRKGAAIVAEAGTSVDAQINSGMKYATDANKSEDWVK